jgi:general secretion pathway protein B
MSFILDALRKSDAERQRAATPGLADVRYAAPRARRSIWLPILALVLAANGVFMAVQWYGRDSQPAAPEAVVAVPEPVVEPPPPPADIRPLSRESAFGEPEFGPPPEPEVSPVMAQKLAGPPAETPLPVPEKSAGNEPAVASSARPSRIVAGDELPTVEQMIGSGTLNIPMLNLDLHVYSDQPASRFVVINTRKYKEGATLTEGPTVESITANGVVLSSQGHRFTLPRK